MDEQEDSEPHLLLVLQKVPHLASVCLTQHALKELRSICSDARFQATVHIIDVQVGFGEPSHDLHTPSLSSLIVSGQANRLAVILHLESDELIAL